MGRTPLIAVLVIAGCAAPAVDGAPESAELQTETGAPVATATAAGTSSPAPSPGTPEAIVEPPTDVLPLQSVIRVTADGLRLREEPSVTSGIAGSVDAGDLLYVTGAADPRLPPRQADGYDWYAVHHAPGYTDWPTEPPREELISAYVAARSDAEWFVELVPPTCPTGAAGVLDIDDLVALSAYERVACLGATSLTVEGTFGCPYCDARGHPYRAEPAWLAGWSLEISFLVPGWSTFPPFPGSIVLATTPGVPPLEPSHRGSIVRVTGHFNDDSAIACTITPGPEAGTEPVHEEAVQWYCRERFVVESWEVIGTDPAFEALVP